MPTNSRPDEVEWWISRGRKHTPCVKSSALLSEKFWAWWKGLQPKWRKTGEVSGVLTAAHQEVLGDWTMLEKLGQNGFLSVLAVLSWWGEAIQLEDEYSVLTDENWSAACEDVQ